MMRCTARSVILFLIIFSLLAMFAGNAPASRPASAKVKLTANILNGRAPLFLEFRFRVSPGSSPACMSEQYQLDFGDGSDPVTGSMSGRVVVTHLYQTPGTYIANLFYTTSIDGRNRLPDCQPASDSSALTILVRGPDDEGESDSDTDSDSDSDSEIEIPELVLPPSDVSEDELAALSEEAALIFGHNHDFYRSMIALQAIANNSLDENNPSFRIIQALVLEMIDAGILLADESIAPALRMFEGMVSVEESVLQTDVRRMLAFYESIGVRLKDLKFLLRNFELDRVRRDLDDIVFETTDLTLSAAFWEAIESFIQYTCIIDTSAGNVKGIYLATIIGTQDSDVLPGTGGADVINGLGGDDTINAMGGDDIVCGGDENDDIQGGSGENVLSGGSGVDIIFGGPLHDGILGDSGDDELHGQGGDDTIQGGDGVDMIFGGSGMDTITGGAGGDIIDGGDQNDFIIPESGNNVVYGGAGNDTILATGKSALSSDVFFGGPGNDLIEADNGKDTLFGEAGDDTLKGGFGEDTCDGGADNGDTAIGCEHVFNVP